MNLALPTQGFARRGIIIPNQAIFKLSLRSLSRTEVFTSFQRGAVTLLGRANPRDQNRHRVIK